MGGPDHRAHTAQAASLLRPQPGPLVRDFLAHAPALHIGLTGVAGLDQNKDRPAVLPGRLYKRLKRLEAQKRVDRQGRARVWTAQPGRRIRLRRAADVAALGIENDRQFQAAGHRADLFQQLHTAHSQCLVKGQLRLDAGHQVGASPQHFQSVCPQFAAAAVGVRARVQSQAQAGVQGQGALGQALCEGERGKGSGGDGHRASV